MVFSTMDPRHRGPEFKLSYEFRQTEDGKYLIEGTVIQRVVAGLEIHILEGVYFGGRVQITIDVGEGKEATYPLVVQGPETPFRFKLPVEPKSVVFNKNGEILAVSVSEGKSF